MSAVTRLTSPPARSPTCRTMPPTPGWRSIWTATAGIRVEVTPGGGETGGAEAPASGGGPSPAGSRPGPTPPPSRPGEAEPDPQEEGGGTALRPWLALLCIPLLAALAWGTERLIRALRRREETRSDTNRSALAAYRRYRRLLALGAAGGPGAGGAGPEGQVQSSHLDGGGAAAVLAAPDRRCRRGRPAAPVEASGLEAAVPLLTCAVRIAKYYKEPPDGFRRLFVCSVRFFNPPGPGCPPWSGLPPRGGPDPRF